MTFELISYDAHPKVNAISHAMRLFHVKQFAYVAFVMIDFAAWGN